MNASDICHGMLRISTQSHRLKDIPLFLHISLALPLPPPHQVLHNTCMTNDDEDGSAVHTFNSALISRVGVCFLMGRGSPSLAMLRASQPTAAWVE